MNPIMQGLNQPSQPQQGIASLAPTQPTQPTPTQPPSNTFVDDMRDKTLPGLHFPEGTGPLNPGGEINDPLRFNQVTAPGNIPDRYKEGFVDFYKQNPDDFMRMGGQAMSYVTTPQGETIQFGDTGGASNFRRYLESIGETPKAGNNFLTPGLLPPSNNFVSPGLPPQEYDPDKYADFAQKAQIKGPWDHLTDNPYAAGPPDDFITIEGIRHYDNGSTQNQTAPAQQQPTSAIGAPLLSAGEYKGPPTVLNQTSPPQTNYSPAVMPPGWQNQQQFPFANRGIASLAGTNPGI